MFYKSVSDLFFCFRTDTDDSSFFPHASSSRRLSSDIFSEQQSQDSFFVTKNKIESTNPANLGVIPEVTQANITDITPSGDIKEFDSTEGNKWNAENSFYHFVSILEPSKETLHLEKEEEGEEASVAQDDMLPIKKNSGVQSENVLSRIAVFEQNRHTDERPTSVIEPKSEFHLFSLFLKL